jgi:mRNA interferase MazF
MVRGEIFRIREPRDARGSEQRGERFAVVVQGDLISPGSTVVVVPTSQSAGEAPFRPVVEIQGQRTKLLADKIRASAVQRLGKSVGRLDVDELIELNTALKLVLALR